MDMNMRDMIDRDAALIADSSVNWEKLRGKTLLISGATGYVPQYIVHGLLIRNDLFQTNINVIALCRSKARADLRFSRYYTRDDFELIIQDIQKPIEIEQEVHYIVHAASPAGLVNSNINPVETFKINVFGCDNLLMLAEEKKAEFLLFSSADVYGKAGEKRFVESQLGFLDTMDVRNVYAYAKRASENLCVCYGQRGVRIKIVRPTQIMGGGISLNDGRIHIDFISQILNQHKIVLKGDGSPVRSYIYITDAVTGILTVLTAGQSGQVYNVCNEDAEASVFEFAEIMSACAKEQIHIEYDMEAGKYDEEVKHAISYVAESSEKLRGLGWIPQISLEDACKNMMNYYGIGTI